MRLKLVPLIVMLLAGLLLLAACGGSAAGDQEPPPETDPPEPVISYLIEGLNIGNGSNGVFIRVFKAEDGRIDRSNPVTTATVTANGGVPLDLQPSGGYQGDLATPLGAGDSVDVTVTVDGQVITGTGIIPEGVIQTAPAHGAVIPAGAPVVVEWTVGSSPDKYNLVIAWPEHNTWDYEPDGDSRSFELAMDRIPYEGGIMTVGIIAVNEGSFTGDSVHPDSSLELENRPPLLDRHEFTIELP